MYKRQRQPQSSSTAPCSVLTPHSWCASYSLAFGPPRIGRVKRWDSTGGKRFVPESQFSNLLTRMPLCSTCRVELDLPGRAMTLRFLKHLTINETVHYVCELARSQSKRREGQTFSLIDHYLQPSIALMIGRFLMPVSYTHLTLPTKA